ncbi:transketolase, partial [bacterium]|nr:transketolase [bacterium]
KFIQSGVMEHNVATLAGALSIDPDLNVFWADFGMFNVAEVYNQLRLNDINHANLNIISTHIGIDVGEDGKTHQSIDYISLFRNLFGFKVYLPGDFNQLQHILEEVFRDYGNKFVGMGRSKLDAVKKHNGEIFYDKDYVWERGRIDEIRAGEDIWIISTGQVAVEAQKAADILRSKNIGAGHYHMATPLEANPDFFRERNIPRLAVTVEDHNSNTGLGAIVVENLGKHTSVEKLGVSHYYYSGKASSLYAKAGIDTKGIVEKISQLLSI